jgi:hypothetical protein
VSRADAADATAAAMRRVNARATAGRTVRALDVVGLWSH